MTTSTPRDLRRSLELLAISRSTFAESVGQLVEESILNNVDISDIIQIIEFGHREIRHLDQLIIGKRDLLARVD